jgi:hypothetical protein
MPDAPDTDDDDDGDDLAASIEDIPDVFPSGEIPAPPSEADAPAP